MKLGIEMEFWIGDEAGRLCDGADVVATHERFHLEFIDPFLEVQTTPRESESALRRELRETLAAGTDQEVVLTVLRATFRVRAERSSVRSSSGEP